jgi:ElaB/YqjD/DUF883 family membrane-anchored ribosome-binding protein
MTIARANQRLVGDLKAVAKDAGELVKATSGQAGDRVGEMRKRLAAAVDATKATYQRLGDKTVATVKATDGCIRAHPYETIGVALGLGLLLGALVRRR